MSTIGLIALLVAFAACIISLICLGIAHVAHGRLRSLSAGSVEAIKASESSASWAWGGRLAVIVGAAALTVCCGILVWCFFAGDVSLDYVVRNRSDATGSLAWLFQLAGLWAGRAGSLLFWAWLISVFAVVVVACTQKRSLPLDNGAIVIIQLVLTAFVGVLLFSPDNMPFTLLDAAYFNDDGTLKASASMLGMNTLLEHWAMAIHPPTLFIGYAGMTVPFAYAISALIVNDDSAVWVERATPYLMFSWLLLGIGIGLGAVWAYVVLGWGGYWGWDPVENASLLPWLVGVALIHSFTIYRQRGAFKRWSVMCACIAFSFVILGTFITRSGIVQSVHAFEGDSVSLVLFLVLIVASIAAGAIGLLVRRKSFGAQSRAKEQAVAVGASSAKEQAAGAKEHATEHAKEQTAAGAIEPNSEDIDSLASREAAYYVNNLIMIVLAVLLAYMTLSSALPEWMPFGGQVLSAGTYNAVARPLGIVYCALIAVCPMLGWRRTNGKDFWKRAMVPGICSIVLFVLLMAYWATSLLPTYNATLASGGTGAEGLLEQGPSWYYNGLAVVGFAVASLLFFNAIFMVGRTLSTIIIKKRAKKGASIDNSAQDSADNPVKASARAHFSRLGGGLSHAAMGMILVGLIGSSMYVTEVSAYLPWDEETDTSSETIKIEDFELTYKGNTIEESSNGDDVLYTLYFDVARDGNYIGDVAPAVQTVASTQQQKLVASVVSFPLEDLFVVYRGANTEGDFSMDVRVNPLIGFVWAGFAWLMVGAVIALFAKRRASE